MSSSTGGDLSSRLGAVEGTAKASHSAVDAMLSQVNAMKSQLLADSSPLSAAPRVPVLTIPPLSTQFPLVSPGLSTSVPAGLSRPPSGSPTPSGPAVTRPASLNVPSAPIPTPATATQPQATTFGLSAAIDRLNVSSSPAPPNFALPLQFQPQPSLSRPVSASGSTSAPYAASPAHSFSAANGGAPRLSLYAVQASFEAATPGLTALRSGPTTAKVNAVRAHKDTSDDFAVASDAGSRPASPTPSSHQGGIGAGGNGAGGAGGSTTPGLTPRMMPLSARGLSSANNNSGSRPQTADALRLPPSVTAAAAGVAAGAVPTPSPTATQQAPVSLPQPSYNMSISCVLNM